MRKFKSNHLPESCKNFVRAIQRANEKSPFSFTQDTSNVVRIGKLATKKGLEHISFEGVVVSEGGFEIRRAFSVIFQKKDNAENDARGGRDDEGVIFQKKDNAENDARGGRDDEELFVGEALFVIDPGFKPNASSEDYEYFLRNFVADGSYEEELEQLHRSLPIDSSVIGSYPKEYAYYGEENQRLKAV